MILGGYFKLQSVIRCEICLPAALKGKWFDQRPESFRDVSLHHLPFALHPTKFLGEKCRLEV